MKPRVTIDRLRIRGLAGRAPTPAEVEAAVRQALSGPIAPRAATAINLRQPHGTTLDAAARAAADAIGRRR